MSNLCLRNLRSMIKTESHSMNCISSSLSLQPTIAATRAASPAPAAYSARSRGRSTRRPRADRRSNPYHSLGSGVGGAEPPCGFQPCVKRAARATGRSRAFDAQEAARFQTRLFREWDCAVSHMSGVGRRIKGPRCPALLRRCPARHPAVHSN